MEDIYDKNFFAVYMKCKCNWAPVLFYPLLNLGTLILKYLQNPQELARQRNKWKNRNHQIIHCVK